MDGSVSRVFAHALVGICALGAYAPGQDDAPAWFDDADDLTEAVTDGLEEWFEDERRYLANIVRMSVEIDGALEPQAATRTCCFGATWKEAEGDAPPGSTVVAPPGGDGGDGRDGDEGGADGEDGEDAKMRIVDEMRFIEFYDEPFDVTLNLSKSGRDKLVPVRVWVGRPYGEPAPDDRWLGTTDVDKARETNPLPPETPEGREDWARSFVGKIGETPDGEDLVAYVDVPMEHLPPLISVQVWTMGTVNVSGTKEEVAERAIVDLQGSRKSAFVFNRTLEGDDEKLFDGPVSLMCFGKLLDPRDTIEPEIIFGEEKNYRSITFYAASASYGIVRASAFDGLLRENQYLATRELRDYRDVFGRNDIAELKYKKSNFETLDDFNSTSTLWKDFWHDHAYKKGRGRRSSRR